MASDTQGAGPGTPGTGGFRRTLIWVLSVVLVLGLGAFLWFEFSTDTRRSAPRETLRIAVSATPHAALLHVAAAQGYFAREGLDVVMSRVSHGKAALDQLALGKADLATAAEVPFVISVLKGDELGIAATVVNASNEMAVVGRRDRGILSARDLAGKRVGVTLGTSGEYFLWAFLIRHRLAPGAITWVDVLPTRLAHELATGGVDAVATWEPVKSAAEAALGSQAITFLEGDAYTVTHVVVGRSEFLKAQPAAIQKLLRALLKAEALVRDDPALALSLVAAQLKLPQETLIPVWNGLDIRVDLRQSQLVTLEDEARWAMARGYAVPGPVPNFLPRLHLDALVALLPDRVTVVR
ncbi:ABC transporter substrate-binding protein [Rhizobacter sp. Root1221]|uniref:ABC transporter substrate-binding protein n=1 Tax=Rhizobacter sp. Root1221 TaxID=1736433 RepID=UPI0006F8A21D|nr:NrtA/SsuA/CpmA family ABC transporter substrate-binding protein [Rhizobacter sp. Root1221]KQV81251.1 hypothetical protein ASC87_10005 [Rhizobacter sp. Root1221]